MQNAMNLHVEPNQVAAVKGKSRRQAGRRGRQRSEKVKFANSTSEYEYENRYSFKSCEKCKDRAAYSIRQALM